MSPERVIWRALRGPNAVEGRIRPLPSATLFRVVLPADGRETTMWECPCDDGAELATMSEGARRDFEAHGWVTANDDGPPQ